MSTVNLSRRGFLRTTSVVGGGLVVGFSMSGCAEAPYPIDVMEGGYLPNAFLQLTPDNKITFYCPRDEMGQGVTTGLSTLIGEELDFDPARFDIAWPGVHSAYNNPDMGVQATGGSNSIKAHWTQLRQVGANTRALLLEAASQDLGVPTANLSTDDGHVVANAKRYPYGQFVATAAGLQAPEAAPLKSVSEFKFIGKEMPRVDAVLKSTGTAQFGIDVDIPGMVHAVVKRSPVAGASLKSFDASRAEQMPGVTDILEISNGVAVVAETYWQAKTAADAVRTEWNDTPLSGVNSAQVRADYAAAMAGEDGVVDKDEGDVEAGLAAADTVHEAEYWAPYLAHAALEPMNAVVRIEDGKAEVWSGVQGVVGAEGLVARASGIDPENIRVHNAYLGGGFGRRGTFGHITEATEIAVATGKPVQLLWTREDDMRHGVYRPASLMRIRAGVDSDGRVTTWDAKRVGGNQTTTTVGNMIPALFPGLGDGVADFAKGTADSIFTSWMADPSSLEGLYEDYDFEHLKVAHTTVDHGLPLTFWRSVGHSYTAFAIESMIDELAHEAGIDPVELRLMNTQNNPRLNNVIRVAGEHWKKMQPSAGRHLGFAAHNSFATDVAEIAEVSVENGQIRVHKVLCVLDCGIAVNPDIVRAQIEGGVMYGLTAALHGAIELEGGAVKESNFHNYPILRMNEAPEVEVIIVDSGTDPTGVGEPGLPPIAPAVANAVFAATGQRLRSLPLSLNA